MPAAPSSSETPPVRKLRGVLLSISRQAERDLDLLPWDNVHRRIHQLRVRMKKLRAILRLLKPGLTPAASNAIRRRLRILKQAFAMNRDQHVLQAMLAKFSVDCRTFPSNDISSQDLPSRTGMRRLKKTAHDLTQSLETLKVRQLDRDDVAAAYARRYARARRCFRICKHSPTAAHLHHWRSPVKEHYLQSLILLRDRHHLKLARKLGSWLGEMHDLAMLRQHCKHSTSSALTPAIRRRMKSLRSRIFRKARDLFELKPARLSRQVCAAL